MAAHRMAAWDAGVMDWASVKKVICEGRKLTFENGGCRVLSDVILPSGGLVWVHFQSRGDGWLAAHDGGAAFDELARTGGEIGSQVGLRKMLAETEFKLTPDGHIWWERFPIDQAAEAVSFVSDASVRAAHFLVSKAKINRPIPLDLRVRTTLKQRFPQGVVNQVFEGKHRQHKFDFGLRVGDETLLVQAVTPDPSSVSSAIVKAIDAREADRNVVPLFVYDDHDRWQSDAFGMLELGGRAAEFNILASADLLRAA